MCFCYSGATCSHPQKSIVTHVHKNAKCERRDFGQAKLRNYVDIYSDIILIMRNHVDSFLLAKNQFFNLNYVGKEKLW